MNLEQLRARGAFVGGLIKVPVEWTHPDPATGENVTEKFDIHVRPLAYGDVDRIFLAEDALDRSKSAQVIAARVVLGEKADERLSYDEAYALEPTLASAFVKAIQSIPGAPEKKA